MRAMKITVEKVDGGIGSDAWQARLNVINAPECSLDMMARGETRRHARAALANAIARMIREVGEVATELHN